MTEPLRSLVSLSQQLGAPANDWVILGEGNTSAAAGDGTFLVKASGAELRTCTADSFVRVRASPVRALLDGGVPTDAEIRATLDSARVEPHGDRRPSIETLLHAVCLAVDGVAWVAHTHPTAVNAITCARGFEAALSGRLFPDEIVVCGPAPLVLPYADPGVPLARAVAAGIASHMARYGAPPGTIWLQNHGLVALGATAGQAFDRTAMAVKLARILAGTFGFGGPNPMPQAAVDRIHTRPDEHHRQRARGGDSGHPVSA